MCCGRYRFPQATGKPARSSHGCAPSRSRPQARWIFSNSLCRKNADLYAGWKQGRQVEQFGVKQLRVLTVTNSEERVENMIDALRDITDGKGTNFFLLVDNRGHL